MLRSSLPESPQAASHSSDSVPKSTRPRHIVVLATIAVGGTPEAGLVRLAKPPQADQEGLYIRGQPEVRFFIRTSSHGHLSISRWHA